MSTRLLRRLRRLVRHSRGASAVEYALLAAGIAAVIVLAVGAMGTVVHANYKGYCDTYSAATNLNNSCGAAP